jgi:hypothetical protein
MKLINTHFFAIKNIKERIPYILLIFIVLFFCIFNYIYLSKLYQLPGPMYGGDLYYHNGGIINILGGNNYLVNPQVTGAYSWTPPLYNWLVSGFALLFGLDSLKAILYFSVIIQALSIISIFFIVFSLTKNEYISLIPAVLINIYFPVLKYTAFAMVLIMPLFVFFLYRYFINKNTVNSLALGIALGVLAISHTNFFIGAVFVLLLFLLYDFIKILLKKNKKEQKNSLGHFFINGVLISLPAFLISLISWHVPLFVFHLNLPNLISNFDFYDLSKFSNMIYVTTSLLKNFIFTYSFSSLQNMVLTILQVLVLVGIFILIFDKNKTDSKIFWIILFFSSIIATNHHYLSYPLLGTNFFPMRIMESYLVVFYFIFSSIILWIFSIKLFSKNKIIAKYAVIFIVIALSLIIFFQNSKYFNEDQYWVASKNSLDTYHTDLKNWVDSNTNINDVFISTNENSFMLSGLTGRKGINFRRAHSGSYVDVDKHYLDAAIILYGNNDELRKSLLKSYDIKYLLWDYYWIQSEFSFDDAGKVVGWFDPLLIIYSAESENILKSSGIKYVRMNTWLDPSNKGERTKMYDTLLVTPDNYRSYETPWNEGLDKYLSIKKEFIYNGQVLARIYEVNVSD